VTAVKIRLPRRDCAIGASVHVEQPDRVLAAVAGEVASAHAADYGSRNAEVELQAIKTRST
jgi:hypothetical protein